MRTSFPIISLVPCLLFPLVSSSTPPDNAQLVQPISDRNLTAPGGGFRCMPNPPYRTATFPHLENCASAMRAFPAASEEGYFHSGGPDDGFQLPDFKRYKDCEVLVELTQPTARPVSSWAEIQVAATQLGMACLMTYSENIGGTTLCGGNDQIRIQITGFGRRVGDVVNETTQDPPATA